MSELGISKSHETHDCYAAWRYGFLPVDYHSMHYLSMNAKNSKLQHDFHTSKFCVGQGNVCVL